MSQVEVLYEGRALLGEGVSWDASEGVLLWVDIEAGHVFRLKPGTEPERIVLGQKVGAVVPRRAGGLVLAVKEGFALMDRWGGPLRVVASPEPDKPENRMNDGKCDSNGRFFAGSISPEPKAAGFYRFDPDGSVQRVLGDITISNGLGFSPDNRTLYYIDSPTYRVDAFDYDAETGSIARRRTLIEVPREHGEPDGMTLDEAGCLWVAHWGGHAVRRYTPRGVLDRTLEVPASQVSNCAFGGPDLSELYITTASAWLDESRRRQEPHAGDLFVVSPGVKGLPAFPFGG
ncbi:MAG TPA: SMP-30/gluconolactonase/LRE family protein [Polyangiaceae bacterium]|nr:SMP-30/gluconolactonase/LRE family protein [Polyangiaceae bacterium]